jgi:hypothetical protein
MRRRTILSMLLAAFSAAAGMGAKNGPRAIMKDGQERKLTPIEVAEFRGHWERKTEAVNDQIGRGGERFSLTIAWGEDSGRFTYYTSGRVKKTSIFPTTDYYLPTYQRLNRLIGAKEPAAQPAK